MGTIVWKFSPSYIEQYFAKNGCERALLVKGMTEKDREEFEWEVDAETLNSSLKVAGANWEKECIRKLENKNCTVFKPDGEGQFGTEYTRSCLTELKNSIAQNGDEKYYYQTALSVNKGFIEQHLSYLKKGMKQESNGRVYYEKNDKLKVIFSNCHPDMLWAKWDSEKGKWILRVIDCKLAKKTKIEHKMQIALYVWYLEEKVKEWNLSDCMIVEKEQAYIWNKGKENPSAFDLKQVFVFLERFLNYNLKNMIETVESCEQQSALLGELEYSVGQKCEWCNNYSECVKWCKENAPMVLYPYLTPNAQRFLKDLNNSASVKENILKIDGFEAYAENETQCDRLRQSVFWKRFLKDKDASLEMLKAAIDSGEKKGKFEERSSAVLELPNKEGMSIIMTAQRDENFDRVYAYGLSLFTFSDDEKLFNLTDIREFLEHYKEPDSGIALYISGNPYKDSIIKKSKNNKVLPRTVTVEIIVKDPDKFSEAEVVFVKILYQYLYLVDKHNREKHAWKSKISVQAYVMDNYELENIKNVLLDRFCENTAAGQENVMEETCALLFWLQGEQLVSAQKDSRPNGTELNPVIVLSSAINRLYVLPSVISNRLVDMYKYFGIDPKYKGRTLDIVKALEGNGAGDRFINKHSNVFNNDVINEYWESEDKEQSKIYMIVNHIRARLFVEKLTLDYIRNNHSKVKDMEIYPPIFRFNEYSTVEDPLLKKLDFEAKYESLLNFQRIRSVRAMEKEEAIEEGKVLHVKCKKITIGECKKEKDRKDKKLYKCEFELLNADKVFDTDKFAVIFVPNTDDGMKHLRSLIDNNSMDGIVKEETGIIRPVLHSFKLDKRIVQADFELPVDGEDLVKIGEDNFTYLVYDEFKDFNLKKNMESIGNAYNIGDDNNMIKHIKDLSGFYQGTGEAFADSEKQLCEYGRMGGYTFSVSQKDALKQLYEKNLTLLLGPPGTGKTDFISRALIVLCRKYYEQGRNLRILVTANSHSAIDNVLAAIAEKKMSEEFRNLKNTPELKKFNIEVKKIEKSKSKKAGVNYIENISKDEWKKEMEVPCVIGATCWQAHKTFFEMWELRNDGTKDAYFFDNYFDIIVIDEASQYRLIDAVIPFSYGNKDTRFLIVGDENQLSPIIQGTYEEKEDIPYYYGSVFRYLYDQSMMKKNASGEVLECTPDYIKELKENYRMNDALVQYAAEKIYGKDYKAPFDRIARQTLNDFFGSEEYLNLPGMSDVEEKEKGLIKKILDPDYPLVMCRIDHKDQTQIVEEEVRWIKMLTRALEYIFGILCPDAKAFWGDEMTSGFFGIISPHHEHIGRIKKALVSDEERGDDLYIGTVDKLQGKEREAVIVSYGVANMERALAEKDFIFSKNRLNVSLTRGKKKTIVFLSKALLEYPMEALGYDKQSLVDGIDFMCGFNDFMIKEGAREEMSGSDGMSMKIYRFGK